jgi:DNA-binding transcriptional regulator PaaX
MMKKSLESSLLSVFQACAILGISEGALRSQLARHRSNGLTRAIRKIGRRVFIDKDELMAWLDANVTKIN